MIAGFLRQNNIEVRRKKRSTRLNTIISSSWAGLTADERAALQLIYARDFTTTKELAVFLSKSVPLARKVLNRLVESDLLEMTASSKTDPNRIYKFKDEK